MDHIKGFISILFLDLHIFEAESLKDKRQVLTSIKRRIQNQFNASVAELNPSDKWQRAAIGVSMISSDKKYLEREAGKIIKLIDDNSDVEILDKELEIIS